MKCGFIVGVRSVLQVLRGLLIHAVHPTPSLRGQSLNIPVKIDAARMAPLSAATANKSYHHEQHNL
jgi:hypothetical protein